MPLFAFEARDRTGKPVRGTRDADDQNALLNTLRQHELTVTRIALAPNAQQTAAPVAAAVAAPTAVDVQPHGAQAAFATAGSAAATGALPRPRPSNVKPPPQSGGGVAHATTTDNAAGKTKSETDWLARADNKQKSLYFRQMQAMLYAGSSIGQSLEVASQHDSSPALRRASAEMSKRTLMGTPWSQSMRLYPGIFSELQTGIIEAGEGSGTLDRSCARLSQYCENDYHIEQTIKRETWYPKMLLGASIFIPAVVPLVLLGPAAAFASVRTSILVVLAAWALWKGASYVAPVLGHAKSWKRSVDGLKLLIPVGGKVTRGLATAKFCRALSATWAAGMAPHRALHLAAGACDNAAIGDKIESVIPQVQNGGSLTGALHSTRQFPPVAMQMLAVGEQTGQMDEQLDKVADFLESDAETAIKQAVKVLGILVFLLIAIKIGMSVVEFYSGFYGGMMKDFDM